MAHHINTNLEMKLIHGYNFVSSYYFLFIVIIYYFCEFEFGVRVEINFYLSIINLLETA